MPDYYLLFILASALLILTPGPNVALIVANSVAYGARYGLLTVAGTTAAVVVHLTLVGIGLQGALGAIGTVFEYVRWVGVAYLLYLGITTWRAPLADLQSIRAQPRSARFMVARAFAVSLTNPKTLLFYGAFFPQFIAASRPVGPQVWTLCLTFIAVAIVIDSLWALVAARARVALAAHGRLRNRISGGLLMGAGLGLALARRR
jgi:threonine/homoserine/homoserine lactone efflux protein